MRSSRVQRRLLHMDITFRGTAPYSFAADLTVGNWTRVTFVADAAINGGGARLVTFTDSSLQVNECYLAGLTFEAQDTGGAPRLSVTVQNNSASDLTIDVTGEATVTIAAGDRVNVDYP